MNAAAPAVNNLAQMHEFLAYVLDQAARPEMLRPMPSPTEPLLSDTKALAGLPGPAASHVAKCLKLAGELRERVRIQALAALSVMASPMLVDESRLVDPKTGARRKPRVLVWAEEGKDQSLNFFWRAFRADYPEMPLEDPGYCEGTDYLSMGTTPAFHDGVPDNQILRLERGEYFRSHSTRNSAGKPLAATLEVCRALEESLRAMLEMLGTFCDVRVETWPHYEGGEMHMLDAADRAYDILCYALEEAQHQLALVNKRGEVLAREFGFDSFDEFRALAAMMVPARLREELARRRGGTASGKLVRSFCDIAGTAEALESACVPFGEAIAHMEKKLMEALRGLG